MASLLRFEVQAKTEQLRELVRKIDEDEAKVRTQEPGMLAPSYDFFMYYFTLVVTPMMLVCGVFFPVDQLPAWLQAVSAALPLTHAVAIARSLLAGEVPGQVLLHLAVLVGYGLLAFHIALVLARRRLLR
jgi:lipooligosaccharide transport system permease protein